MNRFKTWIAAGTMAAAAATVTLPAQAAEYYVVHPDGRITTEHTHHHRDRSYSYFAFSFGTPVIWLDHSYRHHYRDRRAHEWHERWLREHRHHWERHHHHRYSRGEFDDDD